MVKKLCGNTKVHNFISIKQSYLSDIFHQTLKQLALAGFKMFIQQCIEYLGLFGRLTKYRCWKQLSQA